jgi:hypothetical protein
VTAIIYDLQIIDQLLEEIIISITDQLLVVINTVILINQSLEAHNSLVYKDITD